MWYVDNTDVDEPKYLVYALSDETIQYLTLDASDQRIRDMLSQVHRVLFIMLMVWTGYVVVSIIAGRNLHRYSPRVRRLFFK